jgi:hypothetical protein
MKTFSWGLGLSLAILTFSPAFAGSLSQSGGALFGPDSGSVTSAPCGSSGSSPVATSALIGGCAVSGQTSIAFKALADYGVLKSYASFDSTAEPNGYVDVNGTSSFFDIINLNSSGAPVTMKLYFTVTGSGVTNPDSFMRLTVSGNFPLLSTTAGAGVYSITSTWSSAIIMQATLEAHAKFDGASIGTLNGVSDFYSTGRLSAITVFDINGDDISNTVTQTGGAGSYFIGALPSAVPEPSTLLLTAAAAAALALARKRTRVVE